ncbi:MAG: helix-turn-helix transcriptional regulator [Myxococcales bacterium]|nr:helix-turn-helix transcriptional regulator [Myxococcales bacterium]
MKPHEAKQCASVRDLFQTVGSKWAGLIVTRLAESPKRFSELRRELGTVTQKSLTTTLRRLERDGLIKRTVTATIPPRVDYALTELGGTLMPALQGLVDWTVAHHGDVLEARTRYDQNGEA